MGNRSGVTHGMTAETDSEGEEYMRMDVFDGIKHTLRKVEGMIEVALLTLAYYFVWQYAYRSTVLPSYFGMGKYVLLGVYAVLTFLLFHYSDGFKYGHLKPVSYTHLSWSFQHPCGPCDGNGSVALLLAHRLRHSVKLIFPNVHLRTVFPMRAWL